MAAVDELKSRLPQLEAAVAEAQQKANSLDAEAKALRDAANSKNFTLPDQINEFKVARARATEAANQAETAKATVEDAEQAVKNLNQQIASVEQADKNAPVQSTGQTTGNEQQGRADGALTQNPLWLMMTHRLLPMPPCPAPPQPPEPMVNSVQRLAHKEARLLLPGGLLRVTMPEMPTHSPEDIMVRLHLAMIVVLGLILWPKKYSDFTAAHPTSLDQKPIL